MIELVIAAILQITTLTSDGSGTGIQDVAGSAPTTTTTTPPPPAPGGTGNWGDGD